MQDYISAINDTEALNLRASHQMLECFRAYDVRGVIGKTIDEHASHRIGYAAGIVMKAKSAIVGYDARATSSKFANSIALGLNEAGVDVTEIGLCGTEEVYAATVEFGADVGLMVTASHNPINYNGIKIIGPLARPLEVDSEFSKIASIARAPLPIAPHKSKLGKRRSASMEARAIYLKKLIEIVKPNNLPAIRVGVDCGHGAVGPTLMALSIKLKSRGSKIEIIAYNSDPDPKFPAGIPNPMRRDQNERLALWMRRDECHLGVAFDGDFDRCALLDDKGKLLEGENSVALLARTALLSDPKAAIIHDSRVTLALTESIRSLGGRATLSMTGHANFKRVLREKDAPYGGEYSGHHYYKDFYYCDSGMLTWLKVAELMAYSGLSLTELAAPMRKKFYASGEINFEIKEKELAFEAVYVAYAEKATSVDDLDGASYTFEDWRFNLRSSQTEDLLRLNVEVRGSSEFCDQNVKKISSLLLKYQRI